MYANKISNRVMIQLQGAPYIFFNVTPFLYEKLQGFTLQLYHYNITNLVCILFSTTIPTQPKNKVMTVSKLKNVSGPSIYFGILFCITLYGSVWALPTYRVYRLYDNNFTQPSIVLESDYILFPLMCIIIILCRLQGWYKAQSSLWS